MLVMSGSSFTMVYFVAMRRWPTAPWSLGRIGPVMLSISTRTAPVGPLGRPFLFLGSILPPIFLFIASCRPLYCPELLFTSARSLMMDIIEFCSLQLQLDILQSKLTIYIVSFSESRKRLVCLVKSKYMGHLNYYTEASSRQVVLDALRRSEGSLF